MRPAWRVVRALLITDARRLLRDRFLLGAAAFLLGTAAAMRWVLPWLQAEMLQRGVDTAPYLPLGVSYFAVVDASILTGIVGGFLLLETKEEGAVVAMRVTPMPAPLHLVVLGSVVIVSGAMITMALSAVVGVGVPPWPAVVAAAWVGAPTGAVMALLLATDATNKVEAFALMKVTAILGLVPVGAWFVCEPLQWIAGITPPYWGCKLWWAAAADQPWLVYLVAGVIVSGLWLLGMTWRFLRVISR